MYIANTGYNIYINAANPCTASTPNGSPVILPATILAENVDNGGQTIAYFERTIPSPNNTPAASLLQKATCGGSCSGFYLNNLEKNEWAQYAVTLSQPSLYQIAFRVGSTSAGGATFHLERDHVNLTGTLSVAQTGAAFSNVIANNVTLQQGTYPVRLEVETGILTVDQMQFSFLMILPVNLISLNVNRVNSDGHISWKVSEQDDCSNYEIFRSFNETDFTKIGTVSCSGNSGVRDYEYIDSNITYSAGNNKAVYYRLEYTGRNGIRKTLGNGIIRLNNNVAYKLTVYPNPITNGEAYLDLKVQYSAMVNMLIVNSEGQVAMKKEIFIIPGSNIIPLELKKFPKGLYILHLLSVDGKAITETKKIILK